MHQFLDLDLAPADLQLVLDLVHADAEALVRGKHRAGDAPDAEVAAAAFCDELAALQQHMADRRLCESMARALARDGAVVHNLAQEERQAQHDRAYAMTLHESNAEPAPLELTAGDGPADPADPADPDDLDDTLLGKLQALYVGDCGWSEDGDAGESSATGARRATTIPQAAQTERCIACGDDVPTVDAARCPCAHDYCRACLATLFEAALTDESLFPPRCCGQSIPLHKNRVFLPRDVASRFLAKELELGTPNRTYCHRPACSAFVPPAFVHDDMATCPACSAETCALCKGPSDAHDAGVCPQDADAQALLGLATERGWQQCRACRAIVELDTGCNHMTCRCKAEFCYVCGLPWKTCTCEQWDEDRLVTRAEVLVNRDLGGAAAHAGRRARLVANARDMLVANHECTHERWRGRGGQFQCEECHHFLPDYIYECRQCRILACRRCRFNRL